MSEHLVKDEHYWERRRKNNDASKRSREKRRLGDAAMEQKILALSRENELLKNHLENRSVTDTLLTARSRTDFAALPSQSNTANAERKVCRVLIYFYISLNVSRLNYYFWF